MSEKSYLKKFKYDSVRLFYFRTRLRLSNAFDWVKMKLGFPSSNSYDTDTDCSSNSDLQSDCYTESEEEKEVQCSDCELAIFESHHDVICTSDDESNKCKERANAVARKKILRRRRSSRTRSYHSDDHYGMEVLNEQKMSLRSGIGDQPDNNIDDDIEKSMAEGQEPECINVTSKTKNYAENAKLNVDVPERPDIKDAASNIKRLKRRRKPSHLYDDAIVSSTLKTKNSQEQFEDGALGIKAHNPKHSRKTGKIVDGGKITLSNKENNRVGAKPSFLTSYFSSLGQPRAKTVKAPTAHMAFGIHCVRNDSVRKHTCGQEFRKLFGIPEKPKQTKPKQAALVPGPKKTSNNKNASNSGENNAEISEVKGNNTDENRKFDYKLKAPMGTRIRDPPFVNYSPSYAPNPKTYLCGHRNINEYKEVSTLRSHAPKAPFTRQFESLIPKS